MTSNDAGGARAAQENVANSADGGREGPFPIVAIGASAGGLEALRHFFSRMPAGQRIGFVVIVHLDPNKASYLADLLARSTSMPVAQIGHAERVQPGRVHVIPPGKFVRIEDGVLQLENSPPRPVVPMPIDYFLRSLAEDQQERAVSIILSGTDGDGALGLKEVKAAGGMTMAQAPESAEYASMPRSAIKTGSVDYVIPAEDMPAALLAFLEHSRLNGSGSDEVVNGSDERSPEVVQEMSRIISLLRMRAAHDFRSYKPGMLTRRARRRMSLHRVAKWADYYQLLRDSDDEVRALRDDFLIGVTSFFREPELWQGVKEEVLPQLLNERESDAAVRVWVAACATGEEAYSIAMLLLESAGASERNLEVCVFATDVDQEALDVARVGRYPESIAASVAPERLRRFFTKLPDGSYQVKAVLRKAVLFAQHNLLSDPPFSRLDMITCRNLLIYLETDVQRKLIELFHFALKPGGVLFLGKSESIGPSGAFRPVAKASRIYRSATLPRQVPMALPLRREYPRGELPPGKPGGAREMDHGDRLRQALVERYAPPAVLVDRNSKALYFYGETGKYLRQPDGQPTADVIALVQEGMRVKLRAALHQAIHNEAIVNFDARAEAGAGLRVTVAPLKDFPTSGLLLVSFQLRARPRPTSADEPPRLDDSGAVRRLEEDLENTRRELQSTIEELESANEEFKVANEEAMSMNEELQSTNEELETSKEELQSLNEELSAVNNQLEEKVNELEQTNDDLSNLLSSTDIATLFLDRNCHIKRFTPPCTRLFKLIPLDINRPITDIASRFVDDNFVPDARRVLETLTPSEKEVKTADGEWYFRRLVPYRTQDDRIDGVVATFTQVTELRRATEGLRMLANVVRDSNDAVIVVDLEGRIIGWNRGAGAIYGYSESEALKLHLDALVPDSERSAHHDLLARLREGAEVCVFQTRRLRQDGSVIDIELTGSVLLGDSGRPSAVTFTERDTSERNRVQKTLRDSEQRFKLLADSAPVLIQLDGPDGKTQFVNRLYVEFAGRPAEVLRDEWIRLIHADDMAAFRRCFAEAFERRQRFETDFRMRRADGEYRWMRSVGVPSYESETRFLGFIVCMLDIHERKLGEQALVVADRRKDEFLAMLAHELRNPLAPIRNAVQLMRLLENPEPRIQWARDVVERQVRHLSRLIDDLLDVSRIAGGKIDLHKQVLDVGMVIDHALEASRPVIEQRGHRLEVKLPAKPVYIEGDLIRLAQALTNLLNNAAKFTDEGGNVRISTGQEGNQAVIRVADTGGGIAPDLLPHIFELFFQADRSLDRSRGGLGIGLTLVRRLVEMHGGSVEARSGGVGEGSEFVVRLPAAAAPTLGSADPHRLREHSEVSPLKILIVDDNIDAAESEAEILTLSGHDVTAAYTGPAALAAAEADPPDVVLLDIGLPEIDGYEVARRLRALPGMDGLVIVAVSGYGQSEDMRRSEEAGFDHHLVKPINLESLNAILASLAEANRQRGEP